MVRRTFLVRTTALTASLILGAVYFSSCGGGTNQNTNTYTNANANTTTIKACDPATDRAIEAAFENTLANDPKLAGQMKHINYFASNCVLTLEGWADTVEDFKAVLKIALATPNVVTINFDAFWVGPDKVPKPPPGGTCEPGFKQCGDFCIPEELRCSIKSMTDGAKAAPKR